MPRFRTSPRRIGSSRRKTAWESGPKNSLENLVSSTTVVWDTGSQALTDGLTLIRVRGEFVITMRLATAVGDGFENFAVGMCMVSENAFGVGVTAVPAPITDSGWDGWLYHSQHGHITALSTTEEHRVTGARAITIDSKAMRKMKNTDVLMGVVQLGTEVGTASVDFSARTRLLFKLP